MVDCWRSVAGGAVCGGPVAVGAVSGGPGYGLGVSLYLCLTASGWSLCDTSEQTIKTGYTKSYTYNLIFDTLYDAILANPKIQ